MNRTKRMSALGAAALLAIGLGVVPVAASATMLTSGATVATSEDGEATCPKEGKVDVEGNEKEVTVTAPEGQLISGYCVKAGSANQGDGPETVELDEPVAEVTITHSSGKDISHYTVFYVPAPTPTPSEPMEPEEPEEPEEPGEPSESPDVVDGDRDELPMTGTGPAIGYGLVALALAGGGIALLVLRRRRLI